MIHLYLSWNALSLLAVFAQGTSLEKTLLPLILDILAITFFLIGVTAILWARRTTRGTSLINRPESGGHVIGQSMVMLSVCWLLLVCIGISLFPTPAHPVQSRKPVPTNDSQSNLVTTTPTQLKLLNRGELTIGIEPVIPLQAYSDNSATDVYTGFDIELIKAIALKINLKPTFKPIPGTNPLNLINGMNGPGQQQFDIAISGLKITDDLKQQVDFVPYLNVGETLLVLKSEHKQITMSNMDDLCNLPTQGIQTLAVQIGTVAQTDLQNVLSSCKSTQSTIHVTPKQEVKDIIDLLNTKQVNAIFQDATITDYYTHNEQFKGKYAMAGLPVNQQNEGIALRKDNSPLRDAIQTAFATLQRDGTYKNLIDKWNFVSNEQLTPAERS